MASVKSYFEVIFQKVENSLSHFQIGGGGAEFYSW